jgi:hypothetical protein
MATTWDKLLTHDADIREFMSNYTDSEKLDVITSIVLFGICNLKFHYDTAPSVMKLGEVATKAKQMLPVRTSSYTAAAHSRSP